MLRNNFIFKALAGILHYLSAEEKQRAGVTFTLPVVASFLSLVGLATLVPIVRLASEPGLAARSRWVGWLFHAPGFSNEKTFLVFLLVGLFIFLLLKNLLAGWLNYKQVRFTADVVLPVIDSLFVKYTGLPFWKLQETGAGKPANEALIVPSYYLNGVVRQLFTFFTLLRGRLEWWPAKSSVRYAAK